MSCRMPRFSSVLAPTSGIVGNLIFGAMFCHHPRMGSLSSCRSSASRILRCREPTRRKKEGRQPLRPVTGMSRLIFTHSRRDRGFRIGFDGRPRIFEVAVFSAISFFLFSLLFPRRARRPKGSKGASPLLLVMLCNIRCTHNSTCCLTCISVFCREHVQCLPAHTFCCTQVVHRRRYVPLLPSTSVGTRRAARD